MPWSGLEWSLLTEVLAISQLHIRTQTECHYHHSEGTFLHESVERRLSLFVTRHGVWFIASAVGC
jgi:hypothetical protein